jgi:hypothetical protein
VSKIDIDFWGIRLIVKGLHTIYNCSNLDLECLKILICIIVIRKVIVECWDIYMDVNINVHCANVDVC